MLRNLDIKSFRAFEHLGLKNLKRVNLIVGSNDAGKTSVLEALVLLLGDFEWLQKLPKVFRSGTDQDGDLFENFWGWLFSEKDKTKPFTLAGRFRNDDVLLVCEPNQPDKAIRGVRSIGSLKQHIFSYHWDHSPPHFAFTHRAAGAAKMSALAITPTRPSKDAELFNLVAPLYPEREEQIESAMRQIEPKLRRLRYAKLPNTSVPLVYADLGLPKAVPSTQMGQAFTRILHIYCELMATGSEVLLVDEIENGIYFGNLRKFWKGLLETLVGLEVQLFATTHSWECLISAHREACERADRTGSDYDLNIIRLDRVDWGIKATEFGRAEMEAAILNGWDMR